MNRRLQVPLWLMGIAIFSQVLMGLLNVHLINKQFNQPKVWALDSTTYYKTLEGQGKLNLNLYLQEQAHEERLRKLDKKRLARFRQIDSLSGDALQHEIDRMYNGLSEAARPQADSTHRSRSASGTEGQSGADHAYRKSAVSGHPTSPATAGADESGANDQAAQRRQATGKEPGHDCPIPTGRLAEKTAVGSTGELVGSGRSRVVRGDQAQTHLSHWQLISKQGYTYPEIAWAISAVETGYWYRPSEGHNLFGMKKNSRGFYESLSPTDYCLYRRKADSLADYGAYEKQVIDKYNLQSRQAYIDHICRRFCPNPSYRGKLALAFQKLTDVRSKV